MEWFKVCLRKYVDFSGRARRAEFWWFYLFAQVPFLVLYFLGMILGAGSAAVGVNADGTVNGAGAGGSILVMIVMGLAWLWSLAMLLPSIAVSVRRLHDTNRSGWWYLLGLVPFGGLVLLYFFILEGDPGPNMFGPDPKGRGAVAYQQPGQLGQGQYGQQFGQVGQPQFGQPAQPGQYGQPGSFGQPQQPGKWN